MPDSVSPDDERELDALATALREIRARVDLTQREVSDAGDLGRKYVGQAESGDMNPSFLGLVRLARGLGVPLSDVVLLYENRRGRTRPPGVTI